MCWPFHRFFRSLFSTVLFVLILLNVTAQATGSKVITHPIDVLPVSFPQTASDLDRIPSTAREVFTTIDLTAPIVPFDPLFQTLVLEVGDVDTIFSFSFNPEIGYNLSNYEVGVECSNPNVLQDDDVLLGPPVLMENGRANFTASVAFGRSVGETDLTIVFRRPDRTIYSSISVHYIICGISFFYVDKKSGDRSLILNNAFMTSLNAVLGQDDLLIFYTFIQFPDGSNSEALLSDPRSLPDMSTIKTTIDADGPLASHNFDSCVSDHAYRAPNGTVHLDSLCSFGFTTLNETQQPYFAIRLLKHRTGTIVFHFQWDDFVRGTTFDEIFETSLTIRVRGTVSSSVIAITPAGPFQKAGGQLIDCVVINSSPKNRYLFKIGGNLLSPASRKTSPEGWTVLSFISPQGEGKNVSWDLSYSMGGTGDRISCLWAGETDRFEFNYVDEDISIASLSPSFGPISGGTTITCSGFFASFSLAEGSGDILVLGSYIVEKKYITSVTKTSIVFKLPPLDVVQAPSYGVDCFVIVHGIRSNEVKFMYESLTQVSVDLTGGSYEKRNDTHMIPMCGSGTYSPSDLSVNMFADVNKGAPLHMLSYEWRIVVLSTRAEVFKMSGSSDAQSFSVALSKFSVYETYEAIVLVSDQRYKTQVSSSIKVQLTRSKMLGVGLSLDHTRTISLPPVDTRITASVTEHGTCYGRNNRLSYDWTFLSVTKTLTATSKTVDITSPSPRRLGREYMVPSSSLLYGRHKVTVKAYYTDDPTIFGTASTWLNVEPAILQAIIGNGESLIQVSGSSDLEMSAAFSHDPDSASVDGSDQLFYEWQCELSTEGNERFMSVTQCPVNLLPVQDKKTFSISSETLRFARFINSTTYVRYSLIVRKDYKGVGTRSSSRVHQIVEILATDEVLASGGFLSISSTDGRPLHMNHVPYYDTFVLSPGGPPGTSWRFRLLEPAVDTFTFLKNPQNLITLPGFYGSNEYIAGRRALGISEGALKPDTEYKFEVLYESRHAESPNAVQVSIHTMPRPVVTFLPLSRTSGNTETVFSAVAVSSIENYSFKYHFYIKMSDGSEMCIDGCSGQRKVTFRVPMVGTHTVKCAMVDARGKYVIDEPKQVQTLTIHAKNQNESSVLAQSEALQESFDLGDHSAFEVESVHLARYVRKINLNSTQAPELVSELVAKTIQKLSSMYRKTQPNTALGKDYMLIAKSYASIPPGHEAMGSMETFYGLCQMMYYAVQNTPLSERFDMALDLSATFAQLAAHARQLHAGGTTRVRLLAEDVRAAEQNADVNEATLELYELVMPLTVRVLTRRAGCGTVGVANVGDVGMVHVAVLCSKEQGLRLAGQHSAMEWCDRVFPKNGDRRIVFALAEFRDYVRESGVLTLRKSIGRVDVVENGEVKLDTVNLESQGFVLTKTMIAEADDDLVGERITRAGSVTAMADADGSIGNGTCLRLQQDVRATAALFPEYDEVVCRTATTIEYVNTKTFSKELPTHPYSERSITSRILDGRANRAPEEQSRTRIDSSFTSLNGRTFGVKRTECRDLRPRIFGEPPAWWMPLVAVIGTLLCVMVLGLVGVRREVGRNTEMWVDSDAPYIERDVYGRDMGHFDHEQLAVGDADGDEQVVFESPRVKGGVATADGQKVEDLFREHR